MKRYILICCIFLLHFILSADLLLAEDKHKTRFVSIPNLDATTTARDLSRRVKKNRQNEPKYDGYKVTDPHGEEFYVDNIRKPKSYFYMNYVEGESSSGMGRLNIDQDAIVDTIILK